MNAVWNGSLWLDGYVRISILGLEMQVVPMAAQVVVDWNVRSYHTFHGSTMDALQPI